MNEDYKFKIFHHLYRKNISFEKIVKNLLDDTGKKKSGLKFIQYFVGYELLNTISRFKINFYDFCNNIEKHQNKKWFINLYNSAIKLDENAHFINILKSIYTLYFGSINVFLPSYCIDFFKKIKPTVVLDFTMGWGGRMIGCCKSNVKKYIGIDNNINLREPYDDMCRILKLHYDTEIELYFEDCLKIDYSKLDYDCVFTSPPYYNIELYSYTEKKSKDEWIKQFYIPIISDTFLHMKNGGYYCINVNQKMYNDFLNELLGDYHFKYEINSKSKNKEYVYIWIKNTD